MKMTVIEEKTKRVFIMHGLHQESAMVIVSRNIIYENQTLPYLASRQIKCMLQITYLFSFKT